MTKSDKRQPELGVLGTGRMGSRLAAMFARAGRKVVLGSRDSDRSAAIVAKLDIPTLRAGCYSDALDAPAILPAVFVRDGLFDLLDRHCRALRGKLLIDISNPFNADYSDFVTPWDTSAAEELQRRFPQARVVGAQECVLGSVRPAAVRRDAERRARDRRRRQGQGRVPAPGERQSVPPSTPGR